MAHIEDTTLEAGQSRLETIAFTGTGNEYFRIWIVNICLSVLTLGIYSAWAKVRTRRYFYGNTWLDDASFEYHATPMMILKGRIIAVVFLMLVLFVGQIHPGLQIAGIVLIGVLTPFVIWRSIIFNARMSSYRNVRFSFGNSVGPLYGYLLVLPLLPVVVVLALVAFQYGSLLAGNGEQPVSGYTGLAGQGMTMSGIVIGIAVLAFYLMIPYLQKSITAYYFNGHYFGQGKMRARLSAGQYYWIYLKLMLISILLYFLVVVGIAGLSGLVGVGMGTYAGQGPASPYSLVSMVILPLLVLPMIVVAVWLKSYMVTRIRNYSFSKLLLESAISFGSSIRVNRLFWIQFTNILLLVFTLGLAYPWTAIRVTRYKLETLTARIYSDLGEYVSQMQERQSALGEEIGEAFDLDLDLGI